MIELFEDQSIFIDQLRHKLKQKKRVIGCAATGFGKTVVFVHMALSANAKGKTVLILTESVKIFNQIKARVSATLIDAKSEHIYLPVGGIYVGMAQTLCRRQELIDQLNKIGEDLVVIVDESHVGHFTKILEQLKNAYITGFTATPDARWAKHLPLIYKDIVVGPQPHELVLKGRLCGYRHFARVSADLDKLVLQNGEFTEDSQEAVFGDKKVFDGLFEDLRNAQFKKCLIFTASVKDCNIVADQLNKNGFPCVAYHRRNKSYPVGDKEMELRLAKFMKLHEVDICVSVGILTKGFDYDEIDCIIIRRATTSLPLYLQMMGRGSRVLDRERFLPVEQRLKKKFTVYDYGANYIRFGLWDAERDWIDLWNKPKKSKEGVAPIKICPQCEFISNVSAVCCPNCGYEFLKKDIPLEYGKLIEITEIYSRLVEDRKRIGSLTPQELAIYARLKNKKNFAARIARARDIEKPGYLELYAKEMGYKPGWVDWQKKTAESGEQNSFTNFILA